jgi:hypothetical protein
MQVHGEANESNGLNHGSAGLNVNSNNNSIRSSHTNSQSSSWVSRFLAGVGIQSNVRAVRVEDEETRRRRPIPHNRYNNLRRQGRDNNYHSHHHV